MDTPYAADMLHVTPDAVLDLVESGRLKPYGGRSPNYIFRSADVAAMQADVTDATHEKSVRPGKSASARVQTRLTADVRWADITEDDIRQWAARADGSRRQAARTAASIAMQRLDTVLQVLDEPSPQA